MWQHQMVAGRIIHASADLGELIDLVRAAAFWLMIAGQLVFLVVVVEGTCPGAGKMQSQLRIFFKTFLGASFYLSLLWMGYLVLNVFFSNTAISL